MREQFFLKISPDDCLFVFNKDDGRWWQWAPSGEFWESEHGDKLTDAQVADWPGTTLQGGS